MNLGQLCACVMFMCMCARAHVCVCVCATVHFMFVHLSSYNNDRVHRALQFLLRRKDTSIIAFGLVDRNHGHCRYRHAHLCYCFASNNAWCVCRTHTELFRSSRDPAAVNSASLCSSKHAKAIPHYVSLLSRRNIRATVVFQGSFLLSCTLGVGFARFFILKDEWFL